MGMSEAKAALAALEASESDFEYAKAQAYVKHVQAYLADKREFFPNSPALPDVSRGVVSLSTEMEERIEVWMRKHPEYSPFMQTFARYYLLSLAAESCTGKLYGHLAACVMEGGDFYIENGVFYLRDAAGVY